MCIGCTWPKHLELAASDLAYKAGITIFIYFRDIGEEKCFKKAGWNFVIFEPAIKTNRRNTLTNRIFSHCHCSPTQRLETMKYCDGKPVLPASAVSLTVAPTPMTPTFILMTNGCAQTQPWTRTFRVGNSSPDYFSKSTLKSSPHPNTDFFFFFCNISWSLQGAGKLSPSL